MQELERGWLNEVETHTLRSMTSRSFVTCFILVLTAMLSLAPSPQVLAQGVMSDPTLERILMTHALVIERVGGQGGRSATSVDAVQRLIITGEWRTPKAGDEITLADNSRRAWSETEAGADGALPAEKTRGGYALWLVESDEDKVMLLNARGHGMAYVNGEPRAGDPYDNGIVSLPVKLKKGVNEILLQCPRGAVRAELVEPASACIIAVADMTLPDLVVGEQGKQELRGTAIVVNASERPLSGCRMRCADATGRAIDIDAPTIPPLTTRKCAFLIPSLPKSTEAGAKLVCRVAVISPDKRTEIASLETQVDVVESLALQRRTFVSEIDGSVQYYAVRPALKADPGNGLILTLHGAGVEARGQAAAYKSKEWAHIVAPTNRRPFGFDWEDWGRLDAIEVLDIAKSELEHDEQRVYLTGHSMGGHGTWQIGSTFPGDFAAIAPSAGWISFETYAGGRPPGAGGGANDNLTPVQRIMRRAGNASRTLELQQNLEGVGIYVLHGDKDDNVPVEQARTMKAELDKWHTDLAYHEQPGAGHWWGDECVDWPPLMEFLQKHAKPDAKAIDHVVFTTASPGVSASRGWVTILQQIKAFEFSTIDLNRDLAKRTIAGTTENVARLAIDVSASEGAEEIAVELDGQMIRAHASPHGAEFVRVDGKWAAAAAALAPSQKNPRRCGPLKSAFNRRFMFVYGTRGTPEENAWALNKARFDAETFWYRGNGSVDIIADVDFDPNADATRGRNVILYGNADTNAAWNALVADSPVQVHRGSANVGGREIKGDSLACMVVRPRPGSDTASVGVVAGTGAVGQRVADRLPIFVSGVAYPDCVVFDGASLSQGGAGRLEIAAAGFFGNDWTTEAGDFAFRE